MQFFVLHQNSLLPCFKTEHMATCQSPCVRRTSQSPIPPQPRPVSSAAPSCRSHPVTPPGRRSPLTSNKVAKGNFFSIRPESQICSSTGPVRQAGWRTRHERGQIKALRVLLHPLSPLRLYVAHTPCPVPHILSPLTEARLDVPPLALVPARGSCRTLKRHQQQ